MSKIEHELRAGGEDQVLLVPALEVGASPALPE
jgi:hypothetical protein